ncbi:MAG: hypothetical protein PHC53_05420 [Patescibacteria group bacterium]|nr:hypothetical protein [Patescibacteria group bacterium]
MSKEFFTGQISEANQQSENPFRVVAEGRYKAETLERYKEAKDVLLRKLEKIDPALTVRIGELLNSYKGKFGEGAEVSTFQLLDRCDPDNVRGKNINDARIKDWYEKALQVFESDEFRRLYEIYPSMARDLSSQNNFGGDPGGLYEAKSGADAIASVFGDLFYETAFHGRHSADFNTEKTWETLENNIGIFRSLVGCLANDEGSKIAAKIKEICANAQKAQDQTSSSESSGLRDKAERETESWFIKVVCGYASERDPRWQPSNPEAAFELLRNFYLPAFRTFLEERGEKIFEGFDGAIDWNQGIERYVYDYDHKRRSEWFDREAWATIDDFRAIEEAWRSYELAPKPESLSTVIALDREGRAAARILKRFWKEDGHEAVPKIHFLNPKFLTGARSAFQEGGHVTLDKNASLELLREEMPEMIKLTKEKSGDVLLIDATVSTGISFQVVGDLLGDLVGDKNRIKYWSLTGATSPQGKGDLKQFGYYGVESPKATDKPTVLSKRRKDVRAAADFTARLNYALNIFFDVKKADQTEKARELGERLLAERQYPILARLIRKLPLTAEEVKPIAREAIEHGDFEIGQKLMSWLVMNV